MLEQVKVKPFENECPLMVLMGSACFKKKKDCCRKFKKGDRCKKCPGRK
jgi:hypothetical protein